MAVIEIDSNGATRTWAFKGDAATAVIEAHNVMLAAIEDANARAQEAVKPIQDEHHDAETALIKRHEAEIAALRAETSAKVREATAPYGAEAEKASKDFHGVIHKLAPDMCREHMPMINLNQYPFSGVVTIMEHC